MTDSQNQTDSNASSENTTKQAPSTGGGPINLEQIRLMREAQQVRMQQDQKRQNRDTPPKTRPPRNPSPEASVAPATEANAISTELAPEKIDVEALAPRYRSNNDSNPIAAKVPVPSVRARVSDEEQSALDAELLEIGRAHV